MLKFFYKLKRRRGAVLFIVIGFMTLLIAMASTAYFTARNSYKTVVSNYNFQQLYLSTISVSDMLVSAAINETSDTTSGDNNYSGLKDTLKGMITASSVDKASFTAQAPVYGSSVNINTATETDAKKVFDEIYAYTDASGNNTQTIIDGVLDGIIIKIIPADMIVDSDPGKWKTDTSTPGKTITEKPAKWFFTLETTGFFKDNTITVQDTVFRTGKIIETTTSSSPTPPSTSNNSYGTLDTFFTATGQSIVTDPVTGKDVFNKTDSRLVYIATHEITDNAYFQNKYTVFDDNCGPNVFKGGISSSGSIFLNQFNTDIKSYAESGKRSDWYVGGSLVISGNSQHGLGSGAGTGLKDNDLVIQGDLVLYGDGASITARNIIVLGNVYLIGSASPSITGDLFVQGSIKTSVGATADLEARRDALLEKQDNKSISADEEAELTDILHDLSMRNELAHVDQNLTRDSGSTVTTYNKAGAALGGGLTGFSITANSAVDGSTGKIYSATGIVDGDTSSAINSSNVVKDSSWLEKGLVSYQTDVANDTNDGYVKNTVDNVTAQSGLDSKAAQQDWQSFSIDNSSTMDNVLKIDTGANVSDYNVPNIVLDDTGHGSTTNTSTFMGFNIIDSVMDGTAGAGGVIDVTTTTYPEAQALNVQRPSGMNTWTWDNAVNALNWGNYGEATEGGYKVVAQKVNNGSSVTISITVTEVATGKVVSSDSQDLIYWGKVDGWKDVYYVDDGTSFEVSQQKIVNSGSSRSLLDDAGNTLITQNSDNSVTVYDNDNGGYMTISADNKTITSVSTNGDVATIKNDGGTITVDIPYTENGYLLDFDNTYGGGLSYGNGTTVNIGTKAGETMPVILKANFDDGSGTPLDADKNNAFSWRGANWTSGTSSQRVDVQLTDGSGGNAKGNVLFEVGNYDKNTGEYITYNLDNRDDIETATYYQAMYSAIGTKSQVTTGKGHEQDASYIQSTMLNGSDFKDEYENRIMMVSNKFGGTAINSTLMNNTMYGYFYAPNAEWQGGTGTSTVPIVGGMIVSTYKGGLGSFTYGEPNPSIISSLLSKAADVTGDVQHSTGSSSSSSTSTPGDPGTPPSTTTTADTSAGMFGNGYTGTGKNYLG